MYQVLPIKKRPEAKITRRVRPVYLDFLRKNYVRVGDEWVKIKK